MTRRLAVAGAVVCLVAAPARGQQPPSPAAAAKAAAQSAAAQSALIAYLNGLGFAELDRRDSAVAAIATVDAVRARQAEVRRKIEDLVGGVPRMTGPVVPRRFATVDEDGFRIENVAYESLPGYWVTANVYVPPGSGPFPAVAIAPGHGAGKSALFAWGAHFARSGILAIAIDPMGQGERMLHFDPELGVSKVEPSGEHEHANQTALLVGQHIARYWFADGMRTVDYLTARPDVDPARIGTFGCSGGGTASAYLAAMDPRIAVAAVASYVTSFRTLLPGNGPQDAEQTLPSFLSSGLDFADWVELAAPRPLAIVAFEDDFFPVAGAQATYDEARRFYSLLGAPDNLALVRGAGGHCNLGPVMPQVLGFLAKHLKAGEPRAFAPSRPRNPESLLVTPTGQVATSLAGTDAEDIARKEGAKAAAPSRVGTDVRALLGLAATPGGPPMKATASPPAAQEGFRTEAFAFESEPGVVLEARVAWPSAPGPHPATVWLDPAPLDDTMAGAEVARLARAGQVVLAFHPRGVLGEPPPNPSQLALGPYMPLLLRAIAVGKTLVGLRVDDTIRVVDWLVSRPEVDRSSITVYGAGGLGMVALHTAVADERIARVVAERTLVSYRTALAAGLHKNLSEVLVPGVLKRYDVPDLLTAIHPRPVILVNAANAMGQPARETLVRADLAAAFEADRRRGTPDRIRLARRDPRDPIPSLTP